MRNYEIWEQNQHQLRRLQDVKASFDVLKWEKAEKKRKKILDNMRQCPERPIPSTIRDSVPKLKPPFSIYNSPKGAAKCF